MTDVSNRFKPGVDRWALLLLAGLVWIGVGTLLVAVMVGTGIALRHSPLPKFYLAMLDIGIGTALILSRVRYLRLLVREVRGQR